MPNELSPADAVGIDELLPDEAATKAIAEPEKGQVEPPPAEDEAEPEGEAETPEKKSRSQERRERRNAHLAELTREHRDAQERLQRLHKAAEGDAEPREADFADLTEYSIAKAAWQISRKSVAREADEVTEHAKSLERERRTSIAEAYQEQVAEAKGRYQDFDAVVNNPRILIAPFVAEMVMESDASADVAYALASQPEEAARISRMDPVAAARAIGRLEASISRPKPRTETSAPEPIKPVSARGGAAKSAEHMSYAEYVKARKAGSI